jgi:Ca2+-binding RTX toxin-like protein
MAISLTLDSQDFNIAYNASANPDEVGYTGGTTNTFGRLNAEFRVDPIAAQTLTFDNVGDTRTLTFGTALLREDYIAHQPRLNETLPNGTTNTIDYPEFSFSVDRDRPDELALTVNVTVDGVTTPLQFQAIPEVQSGPPGFAFNPPFNRADPAPATLPGSTADADVDFRADFAPVSFVVNGHTFTADISDIVFTQPTGPGDSGAGTNAPVDVESVSLLLRLDAVPVVPPGPDVRVGTDADDTFISTGAVAIFSGGDGDDTLTGGDLADVLRGEDDDDSISGGAGDDFLDGGRGDDDINTGAGDDVVLAGRGDDTVGGMAGSDTVEAGAGNDLVAWNDPTGDLVFGGCGHDLLRGGDVAADTIFGGSGDDLIRAVANQQLATHAADLLFGDRGDDAVLGGNANDTIEGGAGDDTMAGFGGADTFVFHFDAPGEDTINDFDTTADVVQLIGFDAGFDPLANLSDTTSGAVLDLGDAGEVLFFGLLANEFSAGNFIL